MDYSEFLYELNNYIWLGYVLALLATYHLNLGNKSYYIAAIVVVILTLSMLVIEPILLNLSEKHTFFVWHVWYPTWAICNVFGATLIYKIHAHELIKIEFVSIHCVLGMVVMCITQSLRYLDMVVLELNLMGSGFRVIVNTLNIGYLVFLSVPLLIALRVKLSKAPA